MRKAILLVIVTLLASGPLTAGQYRYRLVAKPGDVIGGQVMTEAIYPSASGNSLAYRTQNIRVAYIVKDGAIVVKTGDVTLEGEIITQHGRAVISGSHLAYMAMAKSGVFGIVLDGKFAVKGGDVIDGKKIGGIVDFALTGARLAFSATSFNDDSVVWLFFDGRFVGQVVGEPAVLDCMLAYSADPNGMEMILNGEVIARTQGPRAGALPPTYIDGFELTWVGQPAVARNSFAFVGRSEEGQVHPGNPSMLGTFIVKDGHIIAKNGDVIDGITISAASDPSLNETGTRIAFKATYTDPVSKKSYQGIVLGESEDVTGVAQFALGEGLSSSLTLVNNGTAPVSGNIAFAHQDGSPWKVQTGSSSESTIPFNLVPGASKQVTGQASGATTIGHAIVTSLGGAIDCFSSFAVTEGSKLLTTATVFGHVPGKALSLPVQVDSESQTGIAIANPGSDPVKVRLSLLNAGGTVTSSSVPTILNPLPAGGQVAAFPGELFPDVKQFQGTLRIEVEGIGEVVATGIVVRQGLLSAGPVSRLGAQ